MKEQSDFHWTIWKEDAFSKTEENIPDFLRTLRISGGGDGERSFGFYLKTAHDSGTVDSTSSTIRHLNVLGLIPAPRGVLNPFLAL